MQWLPRLLAGLEVLVSAKRHCSSPLCTYSEAAALQRTTWKVLRAQGWARALQVTAKPGAPGATPPESSLAVARA
eukprot:scaffold973_cov399-Prasinococcus_capsulatus_cf.AAC.8